ncbi:hypothetical protein SNEBB_011267 [Seison nebaliae]|nr:hypothetical protein SNEBB_011267 [Seison nebaliae]
MLYMNDSQKIGLGMLTMGVLLTFLGIIMFFDRKVLALSNILFNFGLVLFIGLRSTSKFFFDTKKWRGSLIYFCGIAILLYGYPLIGLLVEIYGFWRIFRSSIPKALNFLRSLPVIGYAFYLPGIGKIADYLSDQSSSMA